tara:strand:- start:81 stop:416 length:336 start_codon:yes stop_codon:yes gene_type:complete
MALTQTQTVSKLRTLNNTDNIVTEIEVTTQSIDDSDPNTLCCLDRESFAIDYSGGKSASGFVAYESLTQNIILGWISEDLAASSIKTQQAEWIESRKNPPAPSFIYKDLPF